MKITFLTIPYYYINATNSEFLPPMHLLYLSSFLQNEGFKSDIKDISLIFGIQKDYFDIINFRNKFQDWAKTNLLEYDIIGLSCYTSFQYLSTIDVAKICKLVCPNSKIVVGGYHTSAVPHDFIFKGSPIDYCVIGEGESAILKIITSLIKKDTINPIVKEKPIIDINKFFTIDYTLLSEWDKYIYHYDYLSRGCPYGCTFCMESVKTDRRWRNLTIGNALYKIDRAVNHISETKVKNQNMIMLNDANFGMDKKWLKELLKNIIRNNYRVTFFASPRIDNLDSEILELMQNAKFTIDIPVESGSEKILKLMNKTSNPLGYLTKAAKLMKYSDEIQLPFHTHWIFGFPGETNDTINESFEYLQKNHMNNKYGMTEIFLFKLYPGSWIYNNWHTAERLGAEWLIPEYWKKEINFDDYEYNIHPSFSLKNGELLNIVNSKIKPFGKEINSVAIDNHDTCCALLKQENAPWII
jgi:radical SAM superfamily enzyme YgiQ (UPF0313 family)